MERVVGDGGLDGGDSEPLVKGGRNSISIS